MTLRPQFLVLLVALSGCAYGYAGQEAKTRTEKEVKPSVKVVEVKEDPDDEGGDTDETETTEPAEPESPCGTRTFDIFYYTSSTRVTKTLDCVERSVANVERTPMGETTYIDAQAAGLPEGSWYLLVDPKGVRANYLNNDQLLRISREFEIEYFGRDSERGLLVYLFQEEIN